MPSRLPLASRVAIVPALVATMLLAGCGTGSDAPTPSPTATTASAAPAPEPTPEPTATAAPGTPITIGCDQLLTPDDVYAYNSNVGTAPDYTPKTDSPVGVAAADNGLACGWSNQTSGELIEFAVAQPAAEQLTAKKDAAAAAMTAVPTYGTPPAVDGFFTQSNGVGLVQVFTDTYWLVASSSAFLEPGDAAQLVDAAISHLP